MKYVKQLLLLLMLAMFSTSGSWATEINLEIWREHRLCYVYDGDIIFGNAGERVFSLEIKDGATVTLRNATIDYDKLYIAGGQSSIHCVGSCTIILEGTNILSGNDARAISVPGKLTIKGDGKLDAKGSSAHGIWGGKGVDILSGTIISYGGDDGAGICCGSDYTINIYGGNVEAHGGKYAAGIGGNNDEKCGTVNIYGGSVYAWGGSDAPGIGSGEGDGTTGIDGGTVNIYGGYVEAHGGDYAAGIGAGDGGAGGNITIHGGEVKAYGGVDGAGIGGGEGGAGGTINISGGTAHAEGGGEGAGIGGGEGGTGGQITISGGNVEAYGGVYCAGIGGGDDADGGQITINGGEVKAYGGVDGAGIGGGEGGDAGTIRIYGGTVYAEATGTESYGVGIGAGEDGACDILEIYGGAIHAIGGKGKDASKGRAIGMYDGSGFGTAVHLGDNLVAWEPGNISINSNRSYFCCTRREVHINVCEHRDGNITDNGDGTHTVNSCQYCALRNVIEHHIVGADGKCTQCQGKVFAGSGTSSDPYLLTNATYPSFLLGIQYQIDFNGKYFRMTEDIKTDKIANGIFSGILDGDGHTVTLTLGSEGNYLNQPCSMFGQLNGATIKNLHIAGSIYSSVQFNAGIARCVYGKNTIQGCVSSISIHSNITGDCTNGGFIGFINTSGSSLAFDGCAFTGELIGANATNWGGFIGWRDYSNSQCTATFTDCLFAPTAANVNTSTGDSDSRSFCRSNSISGDFFTHCYYTTVLQEADGGQKVLTAHEDPGVLGSQTTDFGLLQVYENGIVCDGKYYFIYKLQSEGTADNPYIVSNKYQWGYIKMTCSDGNTYSGKHLKLTADITDDYENVGTFSGILEGDGHTITLAMGSETDCLNQSCALFYQISDANIQNLRIAGNIYSSAQYNASIACMAKGGNNYIRNCVSTVSINSSRDGDGTNGGFIGIMKTDDARVVFDGCAFLGEMIGAKTTCWGGFIGWREDANGTYCRANFNDCLFAPTTVNIDLSTGNSCTFNRSNSIGGNFFTHCYYTIALREAEGGMRALAVTEKPEDIGSETADYGFLQTYENGIGCNGKYYHASINGDGTAENPYLIRNIDEWRNLAISCSEGVSYFAEHLKLTTDLTVDFVVGGTFKGILEGGGHTITLDFGNESNYLDQSCALFNQLQFSVINNLRIAGNIYSSAQLNGSIARETIGFNNRINNCISTVAIHSNMEGECTNGGFIGAMKTFNNIFSNQDGVTFTGCAFLGKMIGTGAASWGGFIGWREYDETYTNAIYTDCLFAPTYINVDTGTGDSRTFSRSDTTKGVKYTNCYYTTVLQEADGGTQVYSTDSLPVNIGEEGKDYGFIQMYTNGMKCGDLYYVAPEAVMLADNADNSSTLEQKNNCLADVTLDGRTLYRDGSWNTICLPFDVKLAGSVLDGDNVQVRQLNSAESNLSDGVLTLKFEEVADSILKAGTPYLIKWTESDSLVSPVFKRVTITEKSAGAADFDGGWLEGNFSPYAINEHNIGAVLLLTDDNKLAYSTAARMLRNFRAHIVINATKGSHAVTRASIDFGDGKTTGIELIGSGQRKIENNSNGQWYDLSGRKLSGKPTQKGIYIVNGKAVVIK